MPSDGPWLRPVSNNNRQGLEKPHLVSEKAAPPVWLDRLQQRELPVLPIHASFSFDSSSGAPSRSDLWGLKLGFCIYCGLFRLTPYMLHLEVICEA